MNRIQWKNDKEYLDLVQDLLEHDKVQKLVHFTHHKVTNRLEHSIAVSYYSYQIAKKFGLNTRAIARAGLLHDLFYYDSNDKHKIGGNGHNYEHPRIALKNALEITELSELEKDIILKHMCGATLDVPKYAESWIVTLMDKRSSLVELMLGTQKYTLFFYLQIQTIFINSLKPFTENIETVAVPITPYLNI